MTFLGRNLFVVALELKRFDLKTTHQRASGVPKHAANGTYFVGGSTNYISMLELVALGSMILVGLFDPHVDPLPLLDLLALLN